MVFEAVLAVEFEFELEIEVEVELVRQLRTMRMCPDSTTRSANLLLNADPGLCVATYKL